MPSRRHFWWTLQLQWFQWFLLEAVPHFARETWKGPQSCLGREMKADIRSGASFLTPWAPGLPCTDTRFQRSMQQHALLWCISESLDPRLVLGRNHCTGLSVATAMIRCELLPILILVSSCFYWRWQGTTGLFFLLAEFTARPSHRCELSEALSLRPTL